MSLRIAAACCLVLALGSVTACGDDDDDKGGGGSGGAATGGTGATGGSGATGGTTSEGGACKTCAEMIATAEIDPSKVCPASATLLGAVLACTCKPENCGGAGKGCEAECGGDAGSISQACKDCDTQMATGACSAEFAACLADTGADK